MHDRFIRVLAAAALAAMAADAHGGALRPIVPFPYKTIGVEETCRELRRIKADTGIDRFFLGGPGFTDVMFGPVPDDLYAKIGEVVGTVRENLAKDGIEVSWWCSPSIRYFSGFTPIEDSNGNKSKDNKKCPLDEAFAADYAAKVKTVAKVHPKMICIEDDYTLSWGRGLGVSGACFCKLHLADFAKRYGKALTGPEIEAAFEHRTPENRAIRQAFADTVRESLVSLARKVRAAVDEVDPSIRIMLSQPGAITKDGDALEPLVRAFAGGTRPAVRPCGAIYGAETTPASIPTALSRTLWTLEHLPKDIETFYEADVYPHNRFYSSASQLMSLMAGALMMGTDDFLFYCLQNLDDPLEDDGYARAFLSLRPRLEAARTFLVEHRARLSGVRIVWDAADSYLIRDHGLGHGVQLSCGSYLLSKFGVPYTTRKDSKSVALLVGEAAETMSDDDIRALLSGGLILDAPAAALLAKRGFSKEIGADVALVEGRPRIVDEIILPAAGCKRRGRHLNAFYIFTAGTEGTVSQFAEIRPHEGTETWSEFYGVDRKPLMPSVTVTRNSLGGNVAVLAVSLVHNRASGLFNLRKQEMFGRLFERLSPGSVPVAANGTPGIWMLAGVAADGRSMLLHVNNLSGDERTGVPLAFAGEWVGTKVSRMAEDGSCVPLGTASDTWVIPFTLKQMSPEFLVVRKNHRN
ncbi:MAG: hypothetical protein IKO72_09190 [Kiritimatiellae bacterium]|nr:hypothetical protein [Kiritimatiellia bacterium]